MNIHLRKLKTKILFLFIDNAIIFIASKIINGNLVIILKISLV